MLQKEKCAGTCRDVEWKSPGENQIQVLQISNPLADAQISLYGAHVLSFIPKGKEDLLWVSSKSNYLKGKAIRGGIPVCWPWFGPVKAPTHGLARIRDWDFISAVSEADDSTTVYLTLFCPEMNLKASMRINVGRELSLELTSENCSNEPVTLTSALHTYFNIADIHQVRCLGLDGMEYADKVTGENCCQSGNVIFDRETDRIYASTNVVVIDDPVLGRKIRVERMGSSSAVVWNPWIDKAANMADFGDEEYLQMLCVEAANAGCDQVILPPGGKHLLGTRISLIS